MEEKKFKYDISIIVPVYNNEEYIDECLKSILNQKFDINRIQVFLINDGSKDNSLQVLKKYENDNIIVIDKKNSGVSETRNLGLKKAQGKYILFLDSDDYLSKNACKNLFNFFEKHYDEVDLVTYPIVYDINGKYKKHARYSKMFEKGTGVYDLEKHYNLIQTTVNVFIKNEFENNVLFDTKQNFSEDEKFDTEILMKKKKIGFCKRATYYYRRHDNTANSTITNPFYIFEKITSYYESLFNKYEEDGKVPKYVQTLYLNAVFWRITSDVLFPYHYEGQEYDKAIERIKNLLSKLDTDIITSLPYSRFHQYYILNFIGREITKDFKNNYYEVLCDDTVLEEEKTILSVINRFKIVNNNISISGNLPTLLFELEKPEIYLVKFLNDGTKEIQYIPTYETNHSYYMSNIKTNTIYGYDLLINLSKVKSFYLYAKVDNHTFKLNYDFNKFNSNVIYHNKKRIYCNKKRFKISYNNILLKLKDCIKNLFIYTKKNPVILAYRLLAKLYRKKKPIWIYTDKGGLVDNAYTLFKHDITKEDNIDKYYIYNEPFDKIKDKFTEEEQKHLIKFKSIKHKILFLRSDVIYTSFSDLQVYCPFNKNIKSYKDIARYELVYLQHGILHANLKQMYSKVYTEIDKFVVSTNFEIDNLTKNYNYKKEDLICTGMPRMGEIDLKGVKEENKILYAPSWRKYLIGELVNNTRKPKTEVFLKSTFFKETYDFIHSKELQKLLKDNNYTLDFKLHPIFEEYANYYDVDKVKNVNMDFSKIDIRVYKIFVTDFSSFQFDFVKMKRPIIYFLPDEKEFKAGLHTYRELDLKYEDAFGNLCLTKKDMIKEITNVIKNNCKPEEKYLKRMNEFFLDINNPCEDIYNIMKGEIK